MESQFDMSTKLLEQMLLDQQTLAKQMETTGNAVAQLTINQMRHRQDRPPSQPLVTVMRMVVFTIAGSLLLMALVMVVLMFHHTGQPKENELGTQSTIPQEPTCLRCNSPLLMVPIPAFGRISVKTISGSLIYQKPCGPALLL